MNKRDEIYSLCTKELSLILEVDQDSITHSTDFADLGLDSAMAVHFILAVEDKLRIELDPDILERHTNLDSFCAYLAARL